MRKLFLMISALAMVCAGVQAKVRLLYIRGDNMALQQDADMRLWGNARPNSTVKAPVAVRYCFKNFQLVNVANMGGLPLLPFRTDIW